MQPITVSHHRGRLGHPGQLSWFAIREIFSFGTLTEGRTLGRKVEVLQTNLSCNFSFVKESVE